MHLAMWVTMQQAKNEELVRRELALLDSSGVVVSLSLFGAQAMRLSTASLVSTPLLAIKGASWGLVGLSVQFILSSVCCLHIYGAHPCSNTSEYLSMSFVAAARMHSCGSVQRCVRALGLRLHTAGAKVHEYAGRECLSSSTQMQMSWFSAQPSAGYGGASTAATAPSSLGETCGVTEEELEAERRWWQTSGANLASRILGKGPSTFGPKVTAPLIYVGQTLCDTARAGPVRCCACYL